MGRMELILPSTYDPVRDACVPPSTDPLGSALYRCLEHLILTTRGCKVVVAAQHGHTEGGGLPCWLMQLKGTLTGEAALGTPRGVREGMLKGSVGGWCPEWQRGFGDGARAGSKGEGRAETMQQSAVVVRPWGRGCGGELLGRAPTGLRGPGTPQGHAQYRKQAWPWA